MATIPLAAAFGVSNLIFVLKYAGLLGFGVCFLYPTILQLASTYVCIKEFGQTNARDSSEESTELEQKSQNDELSSVSEEAKGKQEREEKSPLLKERPDKDTKRRFYMTPYSNAVTSHPFFVGTIAVIEAFLSVLAIASVFIVPSVLKCDINTES